MAAAAKKKTAVAADEDVIIHDPVSVLESESAPRYQIIDQMFVWKDEEQGVLRIPLRFKFKLLRELIRLEKEEGASETEQLVGLLDGINDTKTRDQLDELWIDDAMALVEAYFNEFDKFNRASLGE